MIQNTPGQRPVEEEVSPAREVDEEKMAVLIVPTTSASSAERREMIIPIIAFVVGKLSRGLLPNRKPPQPPPIVKARAAAVKARTAAEKVRTTTRRRW
jgi:hypothetical protein